MSQCVPNWDLSEPPPSGVRPLFHSAPHDVVPMLEYEVAELTWENGQLAMNGLGPPRISGKFQPCGGGSKYTWHSKPARASGTLESLVNQGTRHPDCKIMGFNVCTGGGDLVPWFADHHHAVPAAAATPAASAATTMDAMVPCDGAKGPAALEADNIAVAAREDDEDCRVLHGNRASVAARVVPTAREWSGCRNQISVSDSATTFGRYSSQQVTLNTGERDFAVGSGGGRGGFTTTTATSQGSLDNTSFGKPCIKTTTTTTDDHDSVCHSTPQGEEEDEGDRKKSSVSTKRSRAAAIHNQSERKRRDKINQRMKTLQKLVPNSNKTDKASMLDEVIEYLKQLQAQVQMMSRMNMPAMMMPMAMQQQLPMASLMAPMGLGMGMGGMGMGFGMDHHLNMIASRPGLAAGISPLLQPTTFMPIAAWDGGTACDQLQPSPPTIIADPLSAFLACQSQPTTEAYNRIIATMFHQFHQHLPSTGGSKN